MKMLVDRASWPRDGAVLGYRCGAVYMNSEYALSQARLLIVHSHQEKKFSLKSGMFIQVS